MTNTQAAFDLTIGVFSGNCRELFLGFLQNGIDVDYGDGYFLYFFTEIGDLEIVKKLFEHGAKVPICEERRFSLIMKAIRSQNHELVVYLHKQKKVPISPHIFPNTIQVITPETLLYLLENREVYRMDSLDSRTIEKVLWSFQDRIVRAMHPAARNTLTRSYNKFVECSRHKPQTNDPLWFTLANYGWGP